MFLEIDNICKAYKQDRVLKGISFAVEQGDLVSLIGPSGAGKTTLLKIVAGLEQADCGEIRSEADLKANPAILVFQDYVLFPTMTVFDNVAFGLRSRRCPQAELKSKVDTMLEYFQLEDKSGLYPAQLSAGQQQRVALARAMVVNPSILLLDEPFANLDRNLKVETAEFIRSFQKESSITTLCVTHDLQEAYMISDKIGIMLDGTLHQYDDAVSVYRNPKNSEVAAFTGHVNEFSAEVYPYVRFAEGIIVPDSLVKVRAEAIELEGEADGPCRIEDILFAGHYQICRVKCNGQQLTVYTSDLSLQIGDRVHVLVREILSSV